MPKVWNRRDPATPKAAVYVGRPTRWGNPYVTGVDGGRDEVIAKYRARLEEMKTSDPAKYNWLIAPLKGKDLVCWCAPRPCHADILLELVNEE